MQRREPGLRAKTETSALGAKDSSRGDRRSTDNSPAPETSKLAPGLYVTATPIGNMADVTHRALEVLAAADVIAAEDTRRTARLLARHGIRTPLTPYHDHNARAMRPRLLRRMRSGEAVALVSDAGTPLISDPGYKLVEAAHKADIAVRTVPGPSSVTAALAVAGLPTDRFFFLGFLPPRAAARRRALTGIAVVEATLVLFETARRLGATLADLAEVLGPRHAAVCREMTKKFEEVRRGSLSELAAHYESAGAPKGEVVLVVGPPDPKAAEASRAASVSADADAQLGAALKSLSPGRAASEVAAATGLSRNELYRRALKLKDGA